MKNILITGASGGIGKAVAEQFIRQENRVYAHYHSNHGAITALQEENPEASVIPVKADLSCSKGVEALINEVPEVDTLILNAGNSFNGLLTDMSDREIDEMIHLHLTSSIKLGRHYTKNMVQSKSGSIIVVSSVFGISGASCEVVYSSVKGGLNAFVKGLAKELGPSGIRVNAVAPGYISTAMNASLIEDDERALIEEIPLGRPGKPVEVASLISFLNSNQAAYITGQVISIDGAWQ
ncbi:SDR family oxidoreductase [Bacillus sp. NTK071]|uniref:elongation factor P 5-aminopentanone reductase n=1 Tax=Bacillus sp. NTK071 TaxID=2802175 RepID=UPI001A8F1094|nr:SDR family oxidoreductase [Bacillus sp. NTK071]